MKNLAASALLVPGMLSMAGLPMRTARPSAPQEAAVLSYRQSLRVDGRDPLRSQRYDGLILIHAQRRRLNPRLVKAVISVESQFHPNALSPQGAEGLMQLLPSTGAEMRVPAESLGDPDANLQAGTAYLEFLFRDVWRRFGLKGPYSGAPRWAVERVLAGYHSGPSVMYAEPEEWTPVTRAYVSDVLSSYESEDAVLAAR